jgi:hypothetical protein
VQETHQAHHHHKAMQAAIMQETWLDMAAAVAVVQAVLVQLAVHRQGATAVQVLHLQ